MDRNIRRVLYTALVAGGLAVVGASSAHAAGEDLLDPVTQGATETIEDAPSRDDLGAGDGGSPAGTGAEAAAVDGDAVDEHADTQSSAQSGGQSSPERGDDGLVGDIVGREGIVRSLLDADVAGAVDGTLGEDGLVDDLLTGSPSDDAEDPAPEAPGTDTPGTGEPGAEEPGADGPGTVDPPGTEEPGTEQPGVEGPGTEEPGVEEPGTDGPETDDPGNDAPGNDTDTPGTGGPDVPGTGRPDRDDHDAAPEADRPGTAQPVTTRPTTRPTTDEPGLQGSGTPEVRAENPGAAAPHGSTPRGTSPPGSGSADTPVAVPGTADVGSGAPEDRGTPGVEPDDEEQSAAGVDLGWGDKAAADPKPRDGALLPGGLSEGLRGTLTEPEEEAEAAPMVVPDDALTTTGHLITGQLSLISLLLGLGIAALRMRRR